MQSGKLDRTVAVQRKSEAVSDTGGVAPTWTTIATVRAELVRRSTDEASTAYGEAGTATLTFRIRYLAGLTNADRLTYEGNAYGLKSIVEIGRRRGLELRCERQE